MKSNNNRSAMFTTGRLGLLTVAGLMLTVAALPAKPNKDKSEHGGYQQTNLVSDLPGVAQLQDVALVNPWGISFSSNGPFWVSDNGAGLTTVYSVTNNTNGDPAVVKSDTLAVIPGAGVPTGQVFNNTGAFNGDLFIFAGEDGMISGWRPDLGVAAEVLASRTNAVYKGIALVTIQNKNKGHNNHGIYAVSNAHNRNDTNGTPLLMLANFSEGTVDIYDTNMVLTQVADPKAPAGYAPFNIQEINGDVFVTFAKQDDAKHDDVPGTGHGLIDVLDLKNGKFVRFATGSDAGGKLNSINSPWGLALAPKSFGEHADELLVGNFGSGTIMTFSGNGKFSGLLEDTNDDAIVIDGLWGLSFGNNGSAGVSNALYFTAGLNGESDGLFGSIVPAFAHEKKDKDKDGE